MDLIYMNAAKEDVGVIQDYILDLAFGADENNFECIVDLKNHCCEAGFFLYFEGSEYGGIIDSIKVDTDSSEVTYSGRTWHGILDSKILEPDAGEDYLIVSGEANSVIGTLLSRMGLTSLFSASASSSGITIQNYKMNRYISGYAGIRKMLKSVGAKLQVTFHQGMAVLSACPLVNYASDEEFDTDQIDFEITKVSNPINHVICLGSGNLSERTVIHLYADSAGNISQTQTITGIGEVTATYDYSNAESDDELKDGGKELIRNSWNQDKVQFSFNSNDEVYDIGDVVGALERITNISVSAEITKKIVTIKNNQTTISYKVGE